MIKFANPEYLYLLLFVPVLIVGFIALNLWKKKDVMKLGSLSLVKQMMPELSLKRSYLKFWLTLAIIVLGIFVIARPQYGTKVDKADKKGIELVVAIDVSTSMLAGDITPDRLTKAKQILTQILNKRKEDKIAIVVFAGEAFIQMPMTADNQSAKLFLEGINTDIVPVQGTAIGDALQMSMSCFSSDENIGRAIVLITDGETHDANAKDMAKAVKDKGIYLSVVGIGTAEGATVPMAAGSGIAKRDTQGNPVVSKLNEEIAREIAAAAEGFYVLADNTNKALNELQSQLDKLEKGEVESVAYSEYDEKFAVFAWPMLILLLLEVCVFDKKNRIFKNIRLFK